MEKPLPLTSPNWWPLAKTVPYVRAQEGSRDVADLSFLLAVNEGRVHVKIVQYDRRANPSTLNPWRVPRDAYELEAYTSNTWMLRQRGDGRQYVRPPYELYFWAPDVKEVWPSDVDAARQPSAASAPAAPVEQPASTPSAVSPASETETETPEPIRSSTEWIEYAIEQNYELLAGMSVRAASKLLEKWMCEGRYSPRKPIGWSRIKTIAKDIELLPINRPR